MAVKIDESTEIQLPLKLVAGLIFVIVAASYFVFHIEERIDMLDMKLEKITMQFDNYKQQPSRGHTDIAVLKTQLEHIQKQIDFISEGKNNGN